MAVCVALEAQQVQSALHAAGEDACRVATQWTAEEVRPSTAYRSSSQLHDVHSLVLCSRTASRVCSHDVLLYTTQDETLRQVVCLHGSRQWKLVAGFIEPRTPAECCQRWRELQSIGTTVKRPWRATEDRLIAELVERYGARQWAVIASHINGRTGKQCRDRWHHQLNPAINKAPWTPREVEVLRRRQAAYGNRWAKITEELPGRTDNAVKNRWYSSLAAKRQRRSVKASSLRRQQRTRTRQTVACEGVEQRRHTVEAVTNSNVGGGGDSGRSSDAALCYRRRAPEDRTALAASQATAPENALAGASDGFDLVDDIVEIGSNWSAADPFAEWLAVISLETWDEKALNVLPGRDEPLEGEALRARCGRESDPSSLSRGSQTAMPSSSTGAEERDRGWWLVSSLHTVQDPDASTSVSARLLSGRVDGGFMS
ncbi:hypothetical protein PybrP1_013187, partial [[Pythium] brassicae (nom. inval.)]